MQNHESNWRSSFAIHRCANKQVFVEKKKKISCKDLLGKWSKFIQIMQMLCALYIIDKKKIVIACSVNNVLAQCPFLLGSSAIKRKEIFFFLGASVPYITNVI